MTHLADVTVTVTVVVTAVVDDTLATHLISLRNATYITFKIYRIPTGLPLVYDLDKKCIKVR